MHSKNHDREWAIMYLVEEEKPLSELYPPATEEEKQYYLRTKAYYEDAKKTLPPDKTFMFVPPNDCDLEW